MGLVVASPGFKHALCCKEEIASGANEKPTTAISNESRNTVDDFVSPSSQVGLIHE
jgi:hypothetical protein